MAKKKKRISKPVVKPMAEPVAAAKSVLITPPKSRGRRRAEIAVWSAIVFLLYIYYRIYVLLDGSVRGWTSAFLSPAFQVPAHHILDYSMGFLPRALSGSLLTFFTGGTMAGWVPGAYFLTRHIITYGLLSLNLGMLIEKAINAKSYLMAMFPLLIIFTPQAVWSRFFSHETLDTLMLLFTLIAFFLIRNEKLMWFAPFCTCLGIMTNYSYALLFFPLVFAMQYYEFIRGGMKRTRLYNLIATTISSFAMGVYMLWVPFHSELVSKYSAPEAIAYLERKAGYKFTQLDIWYITSTIFGRHVDGQKLTFLDATSLGRYGGYFNPIFYVTALLICMPILIFTLTIWRRHVKGEKGFWKKSPYLLFMLAPAIIFPVFYFVFGDIDRLVSAVLLTQVLLMAYVFFADGQNEAFIRLKEIKTWKRQLLYVAVLLGVLVPLMVFRSTMWLIVTAKQPLF